MAKSISAKNKKRFKDQARAYAEGTTPSTAYHKHKVSVERSKKALKKKAYPMT